MDVAPYIRQPYQYVKHRGEFKRQYDDGYQARHRGDQ
jgi:hypothetical protein